jgi:hypothetical protein
VPILNAVEVDLFDDGNLAAPRTAWQVIEAARRRYLTGVLSLGSTPPTNVYLRDGQVYFAERSTDGGLGVRLMVEGVVTREQLHTGALMVGGVEHLGRMFERDASIDRHAVELCVELMTDEVLTAVAATVVQGYRMTMYQRHPSGIDRWLPNRVEVVTHVLEGHQLADPTGPAVQAAPPRTRPALTPPPAAEPAHAAPSEAHAGPPEPTPAEHHAVPARPPEQAHTITTPEAAPADTAFATTVADEVAEAVRRALAAIDAATATPIDTGELPRLDTGELRRMIDDSQAPTA